MNMLWCENRLYFAPDINHRLMLKPSTILLSSVKIGHFASTDEYA